MQNEKILSDRHIEEIEKIVESNYGTKIDLKKYGVIINEINQKMKIFSKKILNLELKRLRLDSIGIYFGKIKSNNKIHLTIEGSQMVGKTATLNVATLSEKSSEEFMRGKEVVPESASGCQDHNFVIIKSREDILGSSLFENGKIKNLLPRSRRIIMSNIL